MSQTKIETPQSRSCRGARGGLSAFERRRSPAPAGMPRQSLGAYPQRSPRSQARATDAVINAYARGVATTRAARV